jgi:hypothetical protein
LPAALLNEPVLLIRIGLTGIARAGCVLVGWLVMGLELALPCLSLQRGTGSIVVPGLALAQLAVGCMSGEYDFAVTGLGFDWSRQRQLARARYALLVCAAVAMALA